MIIGSILLGADELVGEMVKSRIPHMRGESWGPYTALGVVRRGVLLGGVVYHEKRDIDIHVSMAFDRPGWALPYTMRALFDYPFNQLGCVRITAMTARKNRKARESLIRAGFKLEGVHRRAVDGVEDFISYGMLKEECRWLRGKDAKNTASTRAA